MSQELQVGRIVVEVTLEAIRIQNLGAELGGPCLSYCSLCNRSGNVFHTVSKPFDFLKIEI
jgi:hypothetical protein